MGNHVMTSERQLSDFPHRTFDKLRYGDTDRQGHINNAVFCSMMETGRVEFLYDPKQPLYEPGSAFVIARVVIDFRSEILWPGTVEIGTGIASIGRSSFKIEQMLFQNDRCVATGESVVVLMDETTRKSRALPASTVERLSALKLTDI